MPLNQQQLLEKWGKVLDNEALPTISEHYRKVVTAQLLENQERDSKEQQRMLAEVANSANLGSTGTIGSYDPILIALVRRAMPNLIAFDVCGVQPMTGPTGLIFAMKSRYTQPSYTASSDYASGAEALFNEAETHFSGYGVGSHTGTSPARASGVTSAYYTAASGTQTTSGEGSAFNEMALSIDKVTVTAKTRQLKAEYSIELQQDLKALHGLDAEAELSNILSTEILAEINREVIRNIYNNAKAGAESNTATAGIFDLDTDANGRWSVERFKGLMYQIERDANSIAVSTRRGRGNVIITSSDVASALSIAGLLDSSGLQDNLTVDATGNTFAGVLNGRYKVFVDPYAPTTGSSDNYQYYCVGYKGVSPFDAGLFYCPYVPLQQVRAVDPDSFQPKIGFKTRYGLVANPFAIADASNQSSTYGAMTFNTNLYYRLTTVDNLM
jgi:hypothetical protein